MDRTYNVFVDNGLYVLGYYLEKDIKDITIDDIKNSTGILAKKFSEYENCGYYKKNIDMGFHNSAYTQAVKKNSTKIESVLNQYNLILDNIGEDEHCCICGEKHIKLDADKSYISSVSRCLMPRLHSNTFINYINNLQQVNICPICLYLSLISLFNFNKAGNVVVLYNSDDDDFMEDITYDKQMEVAQNVGLQAKESKEKISNINYIESTIENIINKGKLYDGYIQAINFYNGGQSEVYSENIISNKDLNFIKKLMNKSLLSEFKLKTQFYYMITGRLQSDYISCVLDFNKEELRVSKELFNEIQEVYNRLSKDKLELIKDICKKVYKTNNKDEISQLKNINSLSQFEELLIKWNELHNEKTGANIFNDVGEYNSLCNYKEFKTIKNTMLMQFMLLQ